mmetsp:Transcript_10728/g.27249  ORF Transcript_10728/g.27249 Transcript_10728/m.27249 type:complete len:223 (-) Transcript_10728:12-680(-)
MHLARRTAGIKASRPRKLLSKLAVYVVSLLNLVPSQPDVYPRRRELRKRCVVVKLAHRAQLLLRKVDAVKLQKHLHGHSHEVKRGSDVAALQRLVVVSLPRIDGRRHEENRGVGAARWVRKPLGDRGEYGVALSSVAVDVPREQLDCLQRHRRAVGHLVEHHLGTSHGDVCAVHERIPLCGLCFAESHERLRLVHRLLVRADRERVCDWEERAVRHGWYRSI